MQTFSKLNPQKQQELYTQVINLKKEGFGYKRIIKKIKEEQAIKLSLSTLSYWFNHEVKLLGGQNYFELIQSSELSYVLGVMFGDGSIIFNEKRKEYVLRLEAIDKDFVEKFSSDCASILGKESSFAVCYNKPRRNHSATYSVQVRSKQLYYFVKELKNDFEKVKKFIDNYPAEFIQGLADSEGTCSVSPNKCLTLSVCVACSTNFELLEYVNKLLLENYLIKCKIEKTKFAGQADSVINGRVITRTKDLFSLYPLNKKEALEFLAVVGFSIIRKNRKFEDYVFLFEKYKGKKCIVFWKKVYHKEGRFWVRNNDLSINKLNFVN